MKMAAKTPASGEHLVAQKMEAIWVLYSLLHLTRWEVVFATAIYYLLLLCEWLCSIELFDLL